MASLLLAQLEHSEIELYKHIQMASRGSKTPNEVYGIAYNVLAEKGVNPAPDWLESLLADINVRRATLFDPKTIFDMDDYFTEARDAFEDMFFMFDDEEPAGIQGLKDKGFDTDTAHMKWAHIIEDALSSSGLTDSGDKHDLILSFAFKHLGIDVKKFKLITTHQLDKRHFGLTTEQYINWYVKSEKTLTPETQEHAEFIEQAKYVYNIVPFTKEKGASHRVFKDLHPMLREKGLDIAMEAINNV